MMNHRTHPEWCAEEHAPGSANGPGSAIRVCRSRPQGFITEKGTAWARAVAHAFRDSPARTESYVALYGHSESPDSGFYQVRISAADAEPLASLTDVMAGATPEQIREFAAGLRAAQAAASEPEPEAGA